MSILTLILALLRLAPMIAEMIRDGRIRDATTQEVLSALEVEFSKRWQARVDAAVAAGDAVRSSDGVPDPKVASGGNSDPDPFDRANKRR